MNNKKLELDDAFEDIISLESDKEEIIGKEKKKTKEIEKKVKSDVEIILEKRYYLIKREISLLKENSDYTSIFSESLVSFLNIFLKILEEVDEEIFKKKIKILFNDIKDSKKQFIKSGIKEEIISSLTKEEKKLFNKNIELNKNEEKLVDSFFQQIKNIYFQKEKNFENIFLTFNNKIREIYLVTKWEEIQTREGDKIKKSKKKTDKDKKVDSIKKLNLSNFAEEKHISLTYKNLNETIIKELKK